MFGLDDWIASSPTARRSRSSSPVAVVLGLRHATDPDHLAAVTTLIAGTGDRAAGAPPGSGSPGASATRRRCSPSDCRSCSSSATCPSRCRRRRDDGRPRDRRARGLAARSLAPRRLPPARTTGRRTPTARTLAAAGRSAIGLVHGMGGSAGVGVLLLALDPRPRARGRGPRALRALHRALDGGCSRPASASRSSAAGVGRSSRRSRRCSALVSLAFGVWYALGALQLAPYYFYDGDANPTTDVAAYALDALDDRRGGAFEEHLAYVRGAAARSSRACAKRPRHSRTAPPAPPPPPALQRADPGGRAAERPNSASRSPSAARSADGRSPPPLRLPRPSRSVSASGRLTRLAQPERRVRVAVLARSLPCAPARADGRARRARRSLQTATAAIVVCTLPRAPEGKTYEAWVIDAGRGRAGGPLLAAATVLRIEPAVEARLASSPSRSSAQAGSTSRRASRSPASEGGLVTG